MRTSTGAAPVSGSKLAIRKAAGSSRVSTCLPSAKIVGKRGVIPVRYPSSFAPSTGRKHVAGCLLGALHAAALIRFISR